MEPAQLTRFTTATTDTVAVLLFGFGPDPDSRRKRKAELRAEIQARQHELLSLEHEEIRCALNSPSKNIRCVNVWSDNYNDEYRRIRRDGLNRNDHFHQHLDFHFVRGDTSAIIHIRCTNRSDNGRNGPFRYITVILSGDTHYELPPVHLATGIQGKWFEVPLSTFTDLQTEVLDHFERNEESESGKLIVACLEIIREKQDVFNIEPDS